MDNETWIIEVGDAVIRKMVAHGAGVLSPVERLLHCLWVADYSIRNAGDLDAAVDLYSPFQTEAANIAQSLSLSTTHQAFSLPAKTLEREFLDRFDAVCAEIQSYLAK